MDKVREEGVRPELEEAALQDMLGSPGELQSSRLSIPMASVSQKGAVSSVDHPV